MIWGVVAVLFSVRHLHAHAYVCIRLCLPTCTDSLCCLLDLRTSNLLNLSLQCWPCVRCRTMERRTVSFKGKTADDFRKQRLIVQYTVNTIRNFLTCGTINRSVDPTCVYDMRTNRDRAIFLSGQFKTRERDTIPIPTSYKVCIKCHCALPPYLVWFFSSQPCSEQKRKLLQPPAHTMPCQTNILERTNEANSGLRRDSINLYNDEIKT